MAELWFWLLAGMLAIYAVLDGFDFGVGMLHFVLAKNQAERDTLLRSIGPVWDGNEVWLVAAGGTLFGAFPALYAAAFSGFYLPLMLVLWLLLFRALGIELRHQLESALWHQFWDVAFSAASALLALFFGAALGNLVRAPVMVWAYCAHAQGLSSSCENDVRWMTPCASTTKPWGCCMKAFVHTMKKPDSQLPTHRAMVAARCLRGPSFCSWNKTRYKTEDSRKKANMPSMASV